MKTWFHNHPNAAVVVCWAFVFLNVTSFIKYHDNIPALVFFGLSAVVWAGYGTYWWERT